jgi:YfiR/HmsC-like
MIDPSCDTARNHGHAARELRGVGSRAVHAAWSVVLLALFSLPANALSSESWVTSFVRFVEWPQAPADSTFIVCQPPDTPELDLTGKQVRGLTLLVLRVARPRDVSRCNVFVAWPQSGKASIDWQPWLAAIGDASVLSIGLGERFCEIGGAMCVTSNDAAGRENYRVNLDVLARAGFKVNAQLLRKQFPRQAKPE